MIDGLPKGNRSRVFRMIVDQLQTDPVLNRVFKTWCVWAGKATDANASFVGTLPAIRLTPQLGASGWFSPDAHIGPLQIAVEINIQSFDADDCLDLQDAIERAIYPQGDRTKQLAFEARLRGTDEDPLAATGQITFSQPASIQGADGGKFLCVGMMTISVVRAFNP